jgi:ABC-type transport system involved in multi-copper enzyme maturation permease subunit
MKAHQFLASVRTNFVFYRRSRVLVLVAIVVALTLGISLISVTLTSSKQFDLLRSLVSLVEGFCFVFSALLGLLSVSQHVRSRSVKLVLTRPFPLGGWVLSHVVSGAIFIAVMHLFILIGATVLFMVWDLPFQSGLLVEVGVSAFACLTVFTFMMLLSTVVHPLVAAVVAIVFNPASVQGILTMIEVPRRSAESALGGFFYDLLAWLFTGVYYLLPEYYPFSEGLQTVFNTYRVSLFDTPYLILSAMYTPIVAALCLLLSIVVLERKRLI